MHPYRSPPFPSPTPPAVRRAHDPTLAACFFVIAASRVVEAFVHMSLGLDAVVGLVVALVSVSTLLRRRAIRQPIR